jgi:hypothetical protein
MTQPVQNERWLNYPERRVGRAQLLRAKLAAMNENDPRYREIRSRLEARLGGTRDPIEPL